MVALPTAHRQRPHALGTHVAERHRNRGCGRSRHSRTVSGPDQARYECWRGPALGRLVVLRGTLTSGLPKSAERAGWSVILSRLLGGFCL
jgi:hypothetical protein